MLNPEQQVEFERLNALGHGAKDAGNHQGALEFFGVADALATEADDPLKQLHARTPLARALWSLGQYDEAAAKMAEVKHGAESLGLVDEKGIAQSNIGRLAAVKTVKTVPVEQQRDTLLTEAVPHFTEARKTLAGHSHHYFTYANAHHGSLVTALARKRWQSVRLLASGLAVAFRQSPDYDIGKRTYQVNKKGLGQMAVAVALLPLGDRTPVLARYARDNLAR